MPCSSIRKAFHLSAPLTLRGPIETPTVHMVVLFTAIHLERKIYTRPPFCASSKSRKSNSFYHRTAQKIHVCQAVYAARCLHHRHFCPISSRSLLPILTVVSDVSSFLQHKCTSPLSTPGTAPLFLNQGTSVGPPAIPYPTGPRSWVPAPAGSPAAWGCPPCSWHCCCRRHSSSRHPCHGGRRRAPGRRPTTCRRCPAIDPGRPRASC